MQLLVKQASAKKQDQCISNLWRR